MQDNMTESSKNQENKELDTDKNSKKKIKQPDKGTKGETLWKIMSVFLAVIIWFIVMGVESPISERKFTSVPVYRENVNIMKQRHDLSIIVDKDISIDVVVSGRKSDINKLKSSDIYAYIDFGNITSSGQCLLPIEIRLEVDNSVTVKEQSETHTIMDIDIKATVNLQVNAEIKQSMREQGVTLTPLNIKPDIIAVSGPKGVIETLSYAQANLNLSSYGKVERSLTVTEKIVLINEAGEEVNNQFLKIDQTSVEVYISVEAEKEIPIEVNFKHGYYTEKNTVITVNPSKLRVRGSPDFLNTFDKITLPTIDEKKIEDVEGTSLTMDIQLPEVKNVDDITTAVVEIEFINMSVRTISFNIANLRIIPPNGLEYHVINERLQLKFLGPAQNLSYLRHADITATIDLSKIVENGTQTVPIDVVASDSGVFCVGEYTVNVEIY